MLIRELHVLELWIEMNVYDPCSFLLYQLRTAPSWPDSSTGRALYRHCFESPFRPKFSGLSGSFISSTKNKL